jgi:hypothetical protein
MIVNPNPLTFIHINIFELRTFTPLIYPPTPFVFVNGPPIDFVGKYFPIKYFSDVKNIRLPTTKNIRGNRQC